MTNSLGSFDPNVLPMDAFTLGGKASDASRILGLKAPWVFGESTHSLTSDLALRANGSIKWTLGTAYEPDDVVYHDEDGLWYMNLVATDSIEPDYSDSGVEGTTWKWVAGSIGGFVSERGWWIKFADGTLIQHGVQTSNVAINSTTGALFASSLRTLTYPIEFYADPDIIGPKTWNNGSAGFLLDSLIGTESTTQFDYSILATVSLSAASRLSYWAAMGRWKE